MYDLGVLGGGQLARMSVMAAQRMGLSVVSLDPDPKSPAAQVGPSIVGDIYDPEAIAQVMSESKSISFENEFIPAAVLRKACGLANFDQANIVPGIETLEVVQDKLLQRRAYRQFGVPSPLAVEASEAEQIAFPRVLKARTGGYDGKGTRIANKADEFQGFLHLLEDGSWLVEEHVPFVRELAVMVTIDSRGNVSTFPTMVTEQKNHVCDLVYPADVDATEIAIEAVKAVNGVGLFGVELFELGDGSVLVNEIAPRPHNSGHYTLDWGGTSQFEQHVRVACDFPIDPKPTGHAVAMANLLGQETCRDHTAGVFLVQTEFPNAHVHWYGKEEPRPGRKMGHINVVGLESGGMSAHLRERAAGARDAFYLGWQGDRS